MNSFHEAESRRIKATGVIKAGPKRAFLHLVRHSIPSLHYSMKKPEGGGFTDRPSIKVEDSDNAKTNRPSDSKATTTQVATTSGTQQTSTKASSSTSAVASSAGPSATSGAITTSDLPTTSKRRSKNARRKRRQGVQPASPSVPPDKELLSGPAQQPDSNSPTDSNVEMLTSHFGMMGLLELTRLPPQMRQFAPGFDLASMGIDRWPPPGQMHKEFSGPLRDTFVLGDHEIEYPVPPEYLVSRRLGSRLRPDVPLAKLGDPTLFWIFYNLCGEVAQMIAAKELYERGWRYHKTKQQWLRPAAGVGAARGQQAGRGRYHYWNPREFAVEVAQMEINRDDLDDTPTTYRLSSPTLDATLQWISPTSQQQQREQQQQGRHQRQKPQKRH